MNKGIFSISGMIAIAIVACTQSKHHEIAGSVEIPPFPYEDYLEQIDEDQWSPVIGDDGGGFDAISHHIRYPELSHRIISSFADSLLEFYNTILAYNTMAYDNAAAARYYDDSNDCLDQANALDSINLSGISDKEIRRALLAASKRAGEWIKEGNNPYDLDNTEIDVFHKVFEKLQNPLLAAHFSKVEFDPQTIIDDYQNLHNRAINDTLAFRDDLMRQVLSASDFQKKCVLAREFAYANYNSKERNDMELVAIIDQLLRAEEYSPLLYELWLMWRTALQIEIFGGRSNDSAMYNLFYNDMRNRAAVQYITYLASHPDDKVAFAEFLNLATESNISRISSCYIGNNSILDEMWLYEECWKK